MSLSIVASACTRLVVSGVLEIPKATAYAFNALDVLISTVVQYALFNRKTDDITTYIGSRIISVLTATTLTGLFVSPISITNVIALNISSFALGAFFNFIDIGSIGGVWDHIIV